MKNNWSLYQDSEIWKYSFNKSLVENKLSFLELFKSFVLACYNSNLSVLTSFDSSKTEDYPTFVNDLLSFLEDLKSKNKYEFYPRVSSGNIYNFGGETFDNYTFNNHLDCYNKDGELIDEWFDNQTLKKFLNDINHGQKKEQGLSMPFEFETYYGMGKGGVIDSYDFVIKFNSDIWLKKVPCIHCEKQFDNERIRELGLTEVEKYWKDNSVLAELNRIRVISFMDEMKKIINELDGIISVEKENLKFYKSYFNKNGFVE